MARFETVLDAIERDGYQLRPAYPGNLKQITRRCPGASVTT
jgi:hypothetical protein